MEELKKRDIKRYRKEMRKIKKDVREEKGEPPAVQQCLPPTRAPEEIKQIKQGKWEMMKSKSAKNDYKTRVDHEKPETSADFLNYCLKSTKPDQEDIVTVGNIEPISQEVRGIADNNQRVAKQVDILIERLEKEQQQGTKRYNVPTILVITPDTYNVVDLNKLLVEKYKHMSGQEAEYGGVPASTQHLYDIHVTKLFAKHIKPEE